jgi:hypothetical protein
VDVFNTLGRFRMRSGAGKAVDPASAPGALKWALPLSGTSHASLGRCPSLTARLYVLANTLRKSLSASPGDEYSRYRTKYSVLTGVFIPWLASSSYKKVPSIFLVSSVITVAITPHLSLKIPGVFSRSKTVNSGYLRTAASMVVNRLLVDGSDTCIPFSSQNPSSFCQHAAGLSGCFDCFA